MFVYLGEYYNPESLLNHTAILRVMGLTRRHKGCYRVVHSVPSSPNLVPYPVTYVYCVDCII